ncbi:MAG: DUF1294 domain-containing protein [Lachnospirales bacterium]
MSLILVYYILINIITFIVMYIDKQKAIKNKWRIAENRIFLLCILGGFVGMFIGMYTFRHKTQKYKFHILGILSFAIHLFLLYSLYTSLNTF